MQILVYEWVVFSKFSQIWAKIGKIGWCYLQFGPKSGQLVYEWVIFSWKIGIYMGLLSNSVAACPYQNQTWVPPWGVSMLIPLCTQEHSFLHQIGRTFPLLSLRQIGLHMNLIFTPNMVVIYLEVAFIGWWKPGNGSPSDMWSWQEIPQDELLYHEDFEASALPRHWIDLTLHFTLKVRYVGQIRFVAWKNRPLCSNCHDARYRTY